ncbi:MAG: hypothetical protein OEV31_03845 [Gammaproteobacteria bacterium]|nr:hypothetical protein [Gammaproteobacteria bacterium]
METLLFTLVAVALYFIADATLDRIERSRGARFENRSLIFFAIILALAVVSFSALRLIMRASG